MGDPGLMFTFYFPIIFALNSKVGIRFIGSVILCEWMNQVSVLLIISMKIKSKIMILSIVNSSFCHSSPHIIGIKVDASWRASLLVGGGTFEY